MFSQGNVELQTGLPCALLIHVFGILQGGLNIPGISREPAERHRMAASHSPQLGNGLLAESLQTSIAMFGEPCLLRLC